MQKFKFREITNKKNWERFVLSHNPQTFLQSWNWGEVNMATGEEIKRLGFYEGNKLIGVVQMIKQNAKRGSHFLIPAGPLIEWKNKGLVSFVIKKIKEIAIEEKVWFVRIRPEILDTDENRLLFKKLGFVKSPMHLYAENTWALDLTMGL